MFTAWRVPKRRQGKSKGESLVGKCVILAFCWPNSITVLLFSGCKADKRICWTFGRKERGFKFPSLPRTINCLSVQLVTFICARLGHEEREEEVLWLKILICLGGLPRQAGYTNVSDEKKGVRALHYLCSLFSLSLPLSLTSGRVGEMARSREEGREGRRAVAASHKSAGSDMLPSLHCPWIWSWSMTFLICMIFCCLFACNMKDVL